MKKRICLGICFLLVLCTMGCEVKPDKKVLIEHLNFKFNDIEAEYSDVYNPHNGNYTDGADRYSYKIIGAIDVTLDDEVKEPFQIYQYDYCIYDECERNVDDNYVYVYLVKLLELYNKEHEDNQLYLNINTDSLGGSYFVSNTFGGVSVCGEKEKSEDIIKKLDEFKEFVNSKTKKKVSANISISCGETIEYEFN